MPHTCIVWGIDTECANVPIHIQEMSAVRLSLYSENFHIFKQGLRKHFLYVCCGYNSHNNTNVTINYEMNNL